MTLQEILLFGLPISIGLFGLGLHWIIEHELKRPISFDASSSDQRENSRDDRKIVGL